MAAKQKAVKKNTFDIHWRKRLKNYLHSQEFKKNLPYLKKEINRQLAKSVTLYCPIGQYNVTNSSEKIIFLFMGIPGSGKSTLAKIIARIHPGIILSSDWIFFEKLRDQIKDDYYKAYVYLEALMEIYIKKDYSLVIDANNRTASTRAYVYKWAKKHGARPILIRIKALPEDTVGRVTLKGGEKQTRQEKLKGLRAFQAQMEEPTARERKQVKIIEVDGRQPIRKIKKQLAIEISQL